MSPARRQHGEGSITQIKRTGRWKASIELAPDPLTGKRRRKEITDASRAGLVRKLNKLRAEVDAGAVVHTRNPRLNVWLDHYLDVVVDVRPKTWESYRSSLEYVRRSIGKKKIDQLTVDDIRKLHADMLSGKVSGKGEPLSPTTVHTTHTVLRGALAAALNEGRIYRNVATMIKTPSRAHQPIKVLTMPEVDQVVRYVARDRLGSRWAAALLTAARQGELLGLEWDRVDFEANTIDIAWQLQRIPQKHGCPADADGRPTCGRKRGADCTNPTIKAKPDWEHRHLQGGLYLARPKTNTGWRLVPLVEPLRSILLARRAASLEEPNPFGLVWTSGAKRTAGSGVLRVLDGSPIDPSDDSEAWHDILDAAGVPQVRLHDARHTAITALYDLGVPEPLIQQIAGQSTVGVTRGYRAKYSSQLVEAMTLLSNAPIESTKQTDLSITRSSPGLG